MRNLHTYLMFDARKGLDHLECKGPVCGTLTCYDSVNKHCM